MLQKRKTQKWVAVILIFAVLATAVYFLDCFNLIPKRYYNSKDFKIQTVKSQIDFNNNGDLIIEYDESWLSIDDQFVSYTLVSDEYIDDDIAENVNLYKEDELNINEDIIENINDESLEDDIEFLADDEILEASEVFALPSGRFLIVEG